MFHTHTSHVSQSYIHSSACQVDTDKCLTFDSRFTICSSLVHRKHLGHVSEALATMRPFMSRDAKAFLNCTSTTRRAPAPIEIAPYQWTAGEAVEASRRRFAQARCRIIKISEPRQGKNVDLPQHLLSQPVVAVLAEKRRERKVLK